MMRYRQRRKREENNSMIVLKFYGEMLGKMDIVTCLYIQLRIFFEMIVDWGDIGCITSRIRMKYDASK